MDLQLVLSQSDFKNFDRVSASPLLAQLFLELTGKKVSNDFCNTLSQDTIESDKTTSAN